MYRYWLGILFCAILAALAVRSGFYTVALLVLPLAAWYASRIIVHGGFDLWHHARHGSKKEWNGRYYEFGGMQLRAEETDDELVFLEDDILAVVEQRGSKTVELFGPKERFLLTQAKEMALTQAGCERFLLKCPHRDAKKLMLYLQREAFYPHAKRHGKHKSTVGEGEAKPVMTEEKQ